LAAPADALYKTVAIVDRTSQGKNNGQPRWRCC
jgi:hypothetical protein